MENEDILDLEEAIEEDIIRNVTNMAQKWECMLSTNVGLLELKKCY